MKWLEVELKTYVMGLYAVYPANDTTSDYVEPASRLCRGVYLSQPHS